MFLILNSSHVCAQTTGGNAALNFLKLPATPKLSAAGGVNVSLTDRDAGLASNNPALLRAQLHKELALSFNAFFAGTKAYHLTGIHHNEKKKTSFSGSIFYIGHGNIPQTDAAGNQSGTFHPKEFLLQLGAGRKYLEKWSYGANLKIAHGSYGSYNSTALLFDIGMLYHDTSSLFSAGLTAKNMGVQLYAFGSDREDMPFDLQAGITKRLAKAPIAFSLTAQQMHRFKLGYNDTSFNIDNGFPAGKTSFGNHLFNHFVFATHIYLSPNLEATAGFNKLRRTELNSGSTGNGVTGFSAGVKAKFKKLEFQFARAWYQSNHGYNQLGIGLNMMELSRL